MSPPPFEIVWNRIVSLDGETFTQIRGKEFTFRHHGDALRLTKTNQSITRSQMAEAYELVPLNSTAPVQHLRAPSYLYAILMDQRVRKNDW